MEIYENEHDQVDAIKRFFAENGKALAVGVILGVGALVGWRYWSSDLTVCYTRLRAHESLAEGGCGG
ncbi:YfgM family protein, partial [Salmonella enterica]|uniref:YfgM family protein n=1 Tax=Salmonella enterica TaxID=28901 RepID=UPI001F3CF659